MGSTNMAGEGRWWVAAAVVAAWCVSAAVGEGRGNGGRVLLALRETRGNTTFLCSPSGPCLPCQYSEKNDEKYRCSETGYRVPLKCVEIQDGSKEESSNKLQRRQLSLLDHKVNVAVQQKLASVRKYLKWRKLLDDSSTSDGGKTSYITYRSCLPIDGEERLSVLGFEVIMFGLLLISGPVVYLRQKRVAVMAGAGAGAGAVRIPSNSPRF